MKKRIYSWLFGLLLPCLSCFVAGAQEDKVSLTTNAAVGGEVALALNEEAVVGDALQFLRDGVNAIGNPCKWYKVVRPEVEITGKIKKIEATSFRIKSLKIESHSSLKMRPFGHLRCTPKSLGFRMSSYNPNKKRII